MCREGGLVNYVCNTIPFAVSTVHSVFFWSIIWVYIHWAYSPLYEIPCRLSIHTGLVLTTLTCLKQSSSLSPWNYFLIFKSNISASNINVSILGDLNINILKYNWLNMATEYIDLLFSFGCLQVITRPTRCNPTCATLIDHVISNSICANISSFIFTSLISDHFPIICHCNTKKTA